MSEIPTLPPVADLPLRLLLSPENCQAREPARNRLSVIRRWRQKCLPHKRCRPAGFGPRGTVKQNDDHRKIETKNYCHWEHGKSACDELRENQAVERLMGRPQQRGNDGWNPMKENQRRKCRDSDSGLRPRER